MRPLLPLSSSQGPQPAGLPAMEGPHGLWEVPAPCTHTLSAPCSSAHSQGGGTSEHWRENLARNRLCDSGRVSIPDRWRQG